MTNAAQEALCRGGASAEEKEPAMLWRIVCTKLNVRKCFPLKHAGNQSGTKCNICETQLKKYAPWIFDVYAKCWSVHQFIADIIFPRGLIPLI